MFCYLDKTVIFGKDIRDKHVSKRNLHRTKQCRACNLLLNQLISVEYIRIQENTLEYKKKLAP